MSTEQNIVQRIATKAFIVNNRGEILLLREASTYQEGTNIGYYGLPGGRLNPGESYIDGLRREVSEECGLQIEIGKPISVGEWRPVIQGVPHHIVAIFFVCKPLSDKITLSEEHDKYVWVLPQDRAQYALMSAEEPVFTAYLESLVH
jgi:ADP-ribose pyrophosphatase YjhB (NUDIX family)